MFLVTMTSFWWHSAYLMIPFILSSIFAWITYEAAYPSGDDLY